VEETCRRRTLAGLADAVRAWCVKGELRLLASEASKSSISPTAESARRIHPAFFSKTTKMLSCVP
jgi:hypothetical protein